MCIFIEIVILLCKHFKIYHTLQNNATCRSHIKNKYFIKYKIHNKTYCTHVVPRYKKCNYQIKICRKNVYTVHKWTGFFLKPHYSLIVILWCMIDLQVEITELCLIFDIFPINDPGIGCFYW